MEDCASLVCAVETTRGSSFEDNLSSPVRDGRLTFFDAVLRGLAILLFLVLNALGALLVMVFQWRTGRGLQALCGYLSQQDIPRLPKFLAMV